MSTNDAHMHVDPSLDANRPIAIGEDRMVLAEGTRLDCPICCPPASRAPEPEVTARAPVAREVRAAAVPKQPIQ